MALEAPKGPRCEAATYPTNWDGTPFVVPKLRPLGGSSGYAGCTFPHTLRPAELTLQVFQKVHRDRAGAPGILEVAAWRK